MHLSTKECTHNQPEPFSSYLNQPDYQQLHSPQPASRLTQDHTKARPNAKPFNQRTSPGPTQDPPWQPSHTRQPAKMPMHERKHKKEPTVTPKPTLTFKGPVSATGVSQLRVLHNACTCSQLTILNNFLPLAATYHHATGVHATKKWIPFNSQPPTPLLPPSITNPSWQVGLQLCARPQLPKQKPPAPSSHPSFHEEAAPDKLAGPGAAGKLFAHVYSCDHKQKP